MEKTNKSIPINFSLPEDQERLDHLEQLAKDRFRGLYAPAMRYLIDFHMASQILEQNGATVEDVGIAMSKLIGKK